jgi:FKBP-type peptidyl-prolyl cis-trans isomerase
MRDRVVIFVMIGAIVFSSIALGLLFVLQENPGETADTQDTTQTDAAADQAAADTVACAPGAEALANTGTPAGEWPFVTSSVEALEVVDLRAGTGLAAQLGNCITVHYRLALADGTEVAGNNTFGSQPIAFELVQGGLIDGWIQGIPGLQEGGLRRLTIPAALGYGDTDRSGIPGGSTLVFDVELVKVEY